VAEFGIKSRHTSKIKWASQAKEWPTHPSSQKNIKSFVNYRYLINRVTRKRYLKIQLYGSYLQYVTVCHFGSRAGDCFISARCITFNKHLCLCITIDPERILMTLILNVFSMNCSDAVARGIRNTAWKRLKF
jgi:hypothetical protein